MTEPQQDWPLDAVRWQGPDSPSGDLPEPIRQALEQPPEDMLKQKRHRGVYRFESGAGPLIVKWGQARDLFDRYLRNRLGIRSRLKAEWEHLHEVAERGIRTPTPIAWGERRDGGRFAEEWLVEEWVPGVTMFEHQQRGFEPHPELPDELSGLAGIRRLGGWIRRVHDAGVIPLDFHPANIILPFDRGEPVLIDLHDVRFARGPSFGKQVRALGQIIAGFSGDAIDRRRELVCGYAAEEDLRQRLLGAVQQASRKRLRIHRRSQVRRSLKRSSRFNERVHEGRRLRCRKGDDPVEVASRLGEGDWYEYPANRVLDRLLRPLGRGPAIQAWRVANALEVADIGHLRPLALDRPRKGSFAAGRVALSGHRGGTGFLEALDPERPVSDLGHLVDSLARFVGDLHEAGLCFAREPELADFLELADTDPTSAVGLNPGRLRRLRFPRRLGTRRAREETSALARQLGNRLGDVFGRRFDVSYRQHRQARRFPVSWQLDPKRLAIIKVGAIGDVVNTLPLAVALKDRFPEASLAWVVGPVARPLVEGHPAVDEVIVFPRYRFFRRGWSFMKELRGFGPEVVIDAGRTLKTALVSLFSGARLRLGMDRYRSKEGAWLFAHRTLPEPLGTGLVLEHMTEFGEALGAPVHPPRWELLSGDGEDLPVDLDQLSAPRVAVAIGATKPANRWGPEQLAKACRWVQHRGGTAILVGGPAERRTAAHMSSLMEAPPLDLVGETSLPQLARVLSRVDLVVTHDSAPLHLARAVGTPTVALFGAADPVRTGGWEDFEGVVRRQAWCAPCRKRECPLGTRFCMGLLPSRPVIERMAARLDDRSAIPAPIPEAGLPVQAARRGAWRWRWDPELASESLVEELPDLSARFDGDRAEIFNICNTARTIRYPDPRQEHLFVKHYKSRGPLDRLKNCFRASRAHKGWVNGRRLLEMGIRTARPIAVAEHRAGPVLGASYLVMEEVEHQGNVLEHFCSVATEAKTRQRFVRALGHHLRYVHERGIDFGDLKGTNILVTEEEDVLGFCHIDLDRVGFGRRPGTRRLVSALVYLDTSFGDMSSPWDRLRFLKAYFHSEWPLERDRLSKLVEAIDAGVAERRPRRRPPLEREAAPAAEEHGLG